jgi:hypothetical protein
MQKRRIFRNSSQEKKMKLRKLFITTILLQLLSVSYFAQNSEPILIDEFAYGNREDMMLRIDNFTNNLQNDPKAKGHIIVKGNKKSRTEAEKQIKDYLKQRAFNLNRFVFTNKDDEAKTVVRLWVVPEGAKLPTENGDEADNQPMTRENLASLIKNLKEVVSKNSPDKKETEAVIKRWDKRKDLTGKPKDKVIELLFEDVKAVIRDSGVQYQIYSIFSFHKRLPDESELVETEITALVKQAWAEWKKGNKKFAEDFVTDDAFYVFSDGVMNKTQIVEAVGSCQFKDYSLEDFRFKRLAEEAALISYTARQDIVCNGQAAPPAVRSTSVYVRRKGKWLNTFYTETAIPPATSAKPMETKARNALIEELKGVVTRLSPDKNEAKTVAERWDQRKDLAGKTKSEVIDLLYDDVKSVIKDSGTQYLIFSTFAFYKNIPD